MSFPNVDGMHLRHNQPQHCCLCYHANFQSFFGRTSPARDSVFGFQHNIRLSLPQLSSKSESDGHQASDRIPLHTITLHPSTFTNFKTMQRTKECASLTILFHKNPMTEKFCVEQHPLFWAIFNTLIEGNQTIVSY